MTYCNLGKRYLELAWKIHWKINRGGSKIWKTFCSVLNHLPITMKSINFHSQVVLCMWPVSVLTAINWDMDTSHSCHREENSSTKSKWVVKWQIYFFFFKTKFRQYLILIVHYEAFSMLNLKCTLFCNIHLIFYK